ncbi:TonB-dependent vitamin B12 receptor [Lysobacter humi (ex Lee et al. 2017)]
MQFRILSAALLAALAPTAVAQSADALDEVVVTANRIPVAVRDAVAPVEVIEREEIERSQARSLPELLRGRAGVSIGNQGGLGKLTTVFLRGSESDHVLVLVDGVRMGSATSGLVAFQDLPIELIERIEIVRGPRSSLYGSEAIGGVIQIFTRRDKGAPAPRFAVGIGSHETYEASAGFGGAIGRGWIGADFSRQQSEGINACRGFGAPVFAGCFTTEPDRDGYARDALSLRGGLEITDGLTFAGHALRAEGDNKYDGSFVNRSETVQQVVGGELAWTPSESATLRLSGGRNRDGSDNFRNDTIFSNFFSTDRDSATLQGDFALAPAHRVSVGFDWTRDVVRSTTAFDRTRRGNRALFAQYLGDFGAVDLQASARQDDNGQFGEYSTGNLALGVDFGGGWRATVGAGNAFKAPTFNELYFPGFSNPELEPERSRTVEAGIGWTSDAMAVRFDAYDSRVEDLIAYNFLLFAPDNIQRARLRGAELTVNATFADWDLAGSLSRVDARDRSVAGVDPYLPRRARSSGRIDLDRSFGAFRFGVTASAEGERYDDLANTRRLGGYGLVDLRAEYAFARDWRLQARVANVFDRDYETVAFYNQPGRTWFLTLRYAPTP